METYYGAEVRLAKGETQQVASCTPGGLLVKLHRELRVLFDAAKQVVVVKVDVGLVGAKSHWDASIAVGHGTWIGSYLPRGPAVVRGREVTAANLVDAVRDMAADLRDLRIRHETAAAYTEYDDAITELGRELPAYPQFSGKSGVTGRSPSQHELPTHQISPAEGGPTVDALNIRAAFLPRETVPLVEMDYRNLETDLNKMQVSAMCHDDPRLVLPVDSPPPAQPRTASDSQEARLEATMADAEDKIRHLTLPLAAQTVCWDPDPWEQIRAKNVLQHEVQRLFREALLPDTAPLSRPEFHQAVDPEKHTLGRIMTHRALVDIDDKETGEPRLPDGALTDSVNLYGSPAGVIVLRGGDVPAKVIKFLQDAVGPLVAAVRKAQPLLVQDVSLDCRVETFRLLIYIGVTVALDRVKREADLAAERENGPALPVTADVRQEPTGTDAMAGIRQRVMEQLRGMLDGRVAGVGHVLMGGPLSRWREVPQHSHMVWRELAMDPNLHQAIRAVRPQAAELVDLPPFALASMKLVTGNPAVWWHGHIVVWPQVVEFCDQFDKVSYFDGAAIQFPCHPAVLASLLQRADEIGLTSLGQAGVTTVAGVAQLLDGREWFTGAYMLEEDNPDNVFEPCQFVPAGSEFLEVRTSSGTFFVDDEILQADRGRFGFWYREAAKPAEGGQSEPEGMPIPVFLTDTDKVELRRREDGWSSADGKEWYKDEGGRPVYQDGQPVAGTFGYLLPGVQTVPPPGAFYDAALGVPHADAGSSDSGEPPQESPT